MKLYFTSQPIDKIPAEIVVMMCYESDVPFRNLLGVLDWRINGRLSQFVKENKFAGRARELLLMPSEKRFKGREIMILGLGDKAGFDQKHVAQVLDYFLCTIEKKKTQQVCFSLHQLIPSEFEWRNAVRLLMSRLVTCKCLAEVILREPQDLVQDAKRRQINFGPQILVEYE